MTAVWNENPKSSHKIGTFSAPPPRPPAAERVDDKYITTLPIITLSDSKSGMFVG
jgi:hypothetical protein